MSDDKNNIMSDDEYHFPNDEFLHHGETTTADTAVDDAEPVNEEKIVPGRFAHLTGRFPFLKTKKFYVTAGIILVIIIGFFMMHKPATQTQNKTVMPAVTAKPEPQPVRTVVKVRENSPQLLNQISSLRSTQESSQGAMTQVQRHLSELNSKLSEEANENQQLERSVQMLTAQMKILAGAVEYNTKKLTVKKKPKLAHAAKKATWHPKPITYHVKAVVPGRAWIVASNGYSYSVAVGDKIAHYGVVKAINDASGRVYTTSGKVIAYGIDDK